MRADYRFRNWHVRPDPTATVLYAATCVTDEESCDWTSGEEADEAAVTKLIAEHANESEHRAFRRTQIVMATANPGEWL